MPQSPYPIDPDLTAIAIAYRNAAYVADDVLPRVPVDKQKFSFMQYADDAFFNVPDTLVGRRSRPNEYLLDGAEVTDQTEDHGLEGSVPKSDEDNSDSRYDPLGNQVMLLQEMIAVAREKRVAGLVHNAASYPVGLKTTLGAGTYLSDANTAVIKEINEALDKPLMRPTQMVFNQPGWTSFRSHPEIVEAVLGTGASKGNVTRQQVAELFEVQEVVVGTARGNTAKPGQPVSLSRLWGKHLALLYKAPVINAQGVVTWGATFEWGGRVASQEFDSKIGLRGGTRVVTGESVKERTIATQCGYFFENAFA